MASQITVYAGNSMVTGEFPTQRASNVENVSILCIMFYVLCNHRSDTTT